MWDAGLPEELVLPEPYEEPSGVYAVKRPDSLIHQLKSIGFTTSFFSDFLQLTILIARNKNKTFFILIGIFYVAKYLKSSILKLCSIKMIILRFLLN